ncbi:hypothetical protein GCM10009430_49340 [Aquimarina litoralis]|uniref:Uncharacterized protein n=1 Tax=Aquimarina litoralis TaxID=584605 RepID=A0ABN1JB04_9FLAO
MRRKTEKQGNILPCYDTYIKRCTLFDKTTMKFKPIFEKSLKNEIRDLTKNVLNDQWKGRIASEEIESAGILDCEEIISEFLEKNEYGCAFDHLTYVVSETETDLTTDQANKIKQLDKKLNP